jgi:hypothetical protein
MAFKDVAKESRRRRTVGETCLEDARDAKRSIEMVLMAGQARGLSEALRLRPKMNPARQREQRNECRDLLALEEELLRGTHDVRRAIPR